MRKLQQVALVVAAASGLSAIGAGPSVADAPVAYRGSTPPPVGQRDAQAHTWTRSQASVQTSGTPSSYGQRQAPVPQRGAEVSPQVSPQLSPQINPQLSPAPASESGPLEQSNLFRPYQECSPQSLLNANVPVAALAAAEATGVDCDQANSQANAAASARATS
ncbi:hypothetical protein EJ357_20850 [Streptomyces cyaneochromogenes]|uniref:RdlA protein n=1 Tax=Streptomyces cyaneochromogenes TaxID=2496836 RepID=A0A3Q9ETF3_9ACTN|nr:hypothetical protein [Streptomyces cyaneochromogenes]AZQ35647.1 hypothetical protein EJ357_20850 [Streptomyces cyaneochromogenes]